MTVKQTRCRKCRGWFRQDKVVRVGCPCCDFRTSRCEECGGAVGAMRSVLCHVSYWRTRGKRAGGHAERFKAWADEQRERIIKRATRAVAQNLGLH